MNYGGRSFAAGGAMPMEQLTEFNEGGRHEENSLGGIPQGMNSQGQMNLVEEGETKFDAENYIYSDSLKVDKELADAFNLNPKMVGKTFADASKMAGRKKSKREGDAIEEAANNADLENLMEAQEAFKQARIEEKLQEIAELDPEALPALMGQGQPQGDPAMGGQIQEAPMDEQAMMEQQMVAEQQGGGGQPSPEEMAMMQQQQDMAMGQQEGMMRAGGKLPKEVLKARVQSHMSPAEANAYVNSYGNGGYTRAYKKGGYKDSGPPYSSNPEDDNYRPHDIYGQTNSPRTREADKFIANNFLVNGPLTKEDTTSLNEFANMNIQDHDMTPTFPYYQEDGLVIIPRFSNPGRFPMTEDGHTGTEFFEMYDIDKDRDDIRAKARIAAIQEEEALRNKIKKEGFLETLGSSFKKNGGYTTRSYNPGGFMGANPGMMNMANAGMMNTGAMGTSGDPKGCLCADGSTHTACCVQGYEEGSQQGITGRDYQGMFRGRNLPFRHKRALKKADVNLAQGEKVFEEGLSGSGGLRSTAPANWANLDLSGYTKEQQDKILSSQLLRTDPAAFAELNPFLSKQDLKQAGSVKAALEWTPPAQETGFDITPFSPDDGSTRGGDGSGTLKGPGTGSRPVMRPRYRHTDFNKIVQAVAHPFNKDKRIQQSFKSMPFMLKESENGELVARGPDKKGLRTGGNLMQSGQEAGLNPMQGLGSQMRSGGKMCYGCGGAMHNYGGYMNNMPDKKFEFGAGLDIASNVLDKASTFMPPVFKEIVKTASNVTGTMADKKQGQAVTKGDYIGDVIGGATASIPGADKFVDTVTDVATSKNKERQNQMREDAINNPNDPLHQQVIDQEKAMAESKQLQNANKFNKVLDSTLGVATQFINPGEDAGKNAGEVMDTFDDIETIPEMDDIPDLNFASTLR